MRIIGIGRNLWFQSLEGLLKGIPGFGSNFWFQSFSSSVQNFIFVHDYIIIYGGDGKLVFCVLYLNEQ